MPFNGSGTYTLPSGNPVATGTTVSSATNNSTNSDIATALSNCITRNGQSPATANIPLGNNKLTGVAAGSASGDAVIYDQVQYIANVASAGTAGQVLTSAGTGAPTWSSPTTTNLTGGATGSLPYQSAADTTTMLSAGTNGQILTISGGVPSWQNSGTATNATNLASGTAGQIPYQSAPSTTTFIPNGTSGQVLTSNGSSAPSWQTFSTTNAQNLVGGAAYQIPYQTGYSSTGFIANGLSGQVFLSNGSSTAPSWGYYPFSSLSGRPTTLSGYGITDGVSSSGSYSNPAWLTQISGSIVSGAVALATNATNATTATSATTASSATTVTGSVGSSATGTTQSIGTSNTTIATTAFANPASSISASSSGYVKLSSGLIIQWCTVNITGSGSASFTFPITFPTQTKQAHAFNISNSLFNVVLSVDTTYSTSSATLRAVTGSTGSATACDAMVYLIGY